MSGESKCRSCGALVLWVEMHPSGKKNKAGNGGLIVVPR